MPIKARLTILVVLAAAAAVLPAAPASAGYWQRCGDQPQLGAGWYNVRAHNVRCGKARDVAQEYVFGGDRSPFGFACQDRSLGYERLKAACRRNLDGRVQKVRFEFGS